MTAAAQLHIDWTDPAAALSQGPRTVYKRAIANGFTVQISHGSAVVDKGQREYLFGEDGKPLLTEKGGRRWKMAEEKVPTIVASIALKLQHDKAQQGQAGTWVDDAFEEGWAYPSDGSDIQRTIGASQLGTIVDLDQQREDSLAAARAADVTARQRCACYDCRHTRRHLESR
jgi:hypothetical protein